MVRTHTYSSNEGSNYALAAANEKKRVEVRTEYDEDVQPYVHSIAIEWKRVPLPESYREVSQLLRSVHEDNIQTVPSTWNPKLLV
jgi:ERCC4-related helicase